jgi:1-phosphatidylinositol-4-phosphate 5-kinase
MGLFSKIFGGDNDDYKGDLRNDVPHGKGTKKFSNGDIYKGEWKNGFMEGKGIITFARWC